MIARPCPKTIARALRLWDANEEHWTPESIRYAAGEELLRLHEENCRMAAEIRKQVFGSKVVFDHEIVEAAKKLQK
jgi:hypothetical protein